MTDTELSVCTRVITIHIGYYTHYTVTLQMCLEHGMNVAYTIYNGAMSLLEKSIQYLRADRVELLIYYGADINCNNGVYIRSAAWVNDVDRTRLLITAGADVNACGTYKSAIHAALIAASSPVVEELLLAGAVLPSGAMSLARNSLIDSELKVDALENHRLIPSRQSVQ